MNLIKQFNELDSNDTAIAGGKGASLGEMIQAGIPVPTGFVILTDAFEQFLDENHLQEKIQLMLENVKQNNVRSIENCSKKIQSAIFSSKIPADIVREIKGSFTKLGASRVAVRSSATSEDSVSASWAGQLETYLNTTETTLLANVRKCWASLFSARAITYRLEKDLMKSDIGVAVVVQKMIPSEVSGTAFSVHPITENPNQIIIEAGFGLGEAVVSGQVTPDSYVVDKESRTIFTKDVQTQLRALMQADDVSGNKWIPLAEPKASSQKLDDDEILALGDIIIKLEKQYGFPCDIEWARENGQFYILQSRPITTLGKKTPSIQHGGINATSYDFLWRAGFSYLYTTLLYEYGYSKRDFVYSWQDGWHMNFVSKAERKRLSEEGFKLYMYGFEAFRREMAIAIPRYKDAITAFLSADIPNYSNEKLANAFEALMKFFVEILENYFYLDYHSTDEVGRVITENDTNFDVEKLRAQSEAMGRIKLALRAILNHAVYPPNVVDMYVAEIAKRLKIGDEAFKHRYQELLDMLRMPSTVAFSRPERIVWGTFSGNKEIYDADADRIINQLHPLDENATEIRGQVGNPGIYRGRVKKIEFNTKTDIVVETERMQKGDVLVSGSTGPEMILACNKAGAIVTEEGGIISHAAIVSRELGIPSVIGTKVASSFFNDGDLVEVDANAGIVRLLERKVSASDKR